ncbi:MAG: radical SAM protein [Magnetococcales bacterium]|nr:radical SAM protein [Magnetococcales bacterium]
MQKFFALFNPHLLVRKPLFLVRVTWRLLGLKLCKTNPLTGINFASHYQCNFNCQHCYEQAFRKKTIKTRLTLEEKKRILSECIRMGVVNVTFVGGEATIDPDLEELIRACSPWKTYIAIATNGFTLTSDRIKNYKKLGIDKFCFSIDSMDPAEHDRNRGRSGSHERVLQAIRDAKKLGIDVSVQYVVYKDSTRRSDFHQVVDYAVQQGIRLQFKPMIPFGGLDQQQDLLITPEDSDAMLALHQQNPMLIRDSYGGGCPAFQGTITINPYGEVQPCNAVPVSFGNLKQQSLQEILRKGRSISFFNGRYDGCPPAEDLGFINQCMAGRGENVSELPLAEEVFLELGAHANQKGKK